MKLQRLTVALTAAVLIAVGLFYLMQWLVTTGERANQPPVPGPGLERIRVVAEPPPPPPPPVTTRTAPEPLLPQRPQLALALPAITADAMPLTPPALELPLQISGRLQRDGVTATVAGGNALAPFAAGGESFTGAELVPVASARPRYPRSAAERGIEGWVELIYVVTGAGRVENIRVLDASPRGIFEDAAVHAMSNWVYAPFYVKGEPVAREATQLIRFRLEDIRELHLWDD